MRHFVRFSVLLLALLLLCCCDRGRSLTPLSPDAVVLAFGDSLTYGVGAGEGGSYPQQLEDLIARRVVNSGVSGEVSADGARRLPAVLDEYNPDLLILCHGGNDLLRKLDRQQLSTNLRYMYEAADQRGIEVVMIAVPQPNLLISDAPLYAELAESLKLPLLEETLADLLKTPAMKSDAIHLNSSGYRRLAEAVTVLLKDEGAL